MMSPGGLMRVGVREGVMGRGGDEEMEARRGGEPGRVGAGASGKVKLKTRGGWRGTVRLTTRRWSQSGDCVVTSISGRRASAVGRSESSVSTGVAMSELIAASDMDECWRRVGNTEYSVLSTFVSSAVAHSLL